jgi:hypothetical protein
MSSLSERSASLILLHPGDDVAVVGVDTPEGARLTIAGSDLVATAAIPPGHKVALRTIPSGEPVRKYGEVIGHATAPIAPGDRVHVHNLESGPLRAGHELPRRARRRRDRPPTAPSRASAGRTARWARATSSGCS